MNTHDYSSDCDHRLSLRRVLLAASVLMFFANVAGATDKAWTGTTVKSYGTAGNWSPSGAPTATDDIISNNADANTSTFTTSTSLEVHNFANTHDWALYSTGSGVSAHFTINGLLSQSTADTTLAFYSLNANSTLSLAVANVEVTAGTLNLGSLNSARLGSLSISSGVTVGSGATLSMNVYSGSSAGNGDYALGAVTNNGTITLANRTGGGVAFTASATSLSGTNAAATIRGNAGAGSHATLALTGAGATGYAGLLEDGEAVLALVKSGEGTQTLTGASTFSGGTTISNGTLVAGNASALGVGPVVITGGTLAATVNLSGIGDFTMSGGTWSVSLDSSSVSNGAITSDGGTFGITGGTLSLSGDSIDYGMTYKLLSGFTGGSVAGLTITGYDSVGYNAVLNGSGALSFVSAIPEPTTAGLIAGGFALLAGALLRRRSVRRCTTGPSL